jgi:hypothetical protein
MLIPFTAFTMKAHWEVEVLLHSLLTLALDGGERSASHSGHFIPGEKAPSTHRKSQSQSGHIGKKKNSLTLLGIEPYFLHCPACSLVTILIKTYK